MHLFTYGTLTFPEIWQAVLGDIIVGRDFEHIPAQALNYQIFRVAGAVYPGIIATPNPSPSEKGAMSEHSGSPPSALCTPPSIPGILYLNLDEPALERLDQFEDDFYVRQPITVTSEDGRELEAEAYVVPENRRDVLTNDIWTAEEFAARGNLAEFVMRYSGFNRIS